MFFKYYQRVTLSSLKRVQRMSGLYNIHMIFHACTKIESTPDKELRFEIHSGKLDVIRSYFDPEMEYGEGWEYLQNIGLEDIKLDTMLAIFYNNSVKGGRCHVL